ncbi:MAG: sugar phosphate nucleotidyltransferase [Pseudomonadota bacterium]
MKNRPRTAIFPVAGRGTRMRPATLAVPKELLPVVDTPLIDFAIDEAIEAGCERLVFVTHPDKDAIRQHVLARHEHRADIHFVNQPRALGLGHAVYCARGASLPGPVAVLLPDDVILGPKGCLSEMVAVNAPRGHRIATMPVIRAHVSRYGILSARHTVGPLIPANGIVEKPAPEEAPSTLAVVGRYILDADIFDALAATPPGAGGEIQLTDAIAATSRSVGLNGVMFTGRRFDCGCKEGLLEATMARAALDPAYAHIVDKPRKPAIHAA